MKQNSKINNEHILVHSTYKMMGGIFNGFGLYMLVERGYNAQEAGICLSITNALYLIFSPIISNYLDRTKKITIFETNIFSSLLVCIFYLISFLLASKSLLLSIVFIIGNSIFSSMQPLINAYSSIFINNGLKINYPIARAAGSLSYGVVCALFGYLSVKYSYLSVIGAGIIFSLLMFITTSAIRKTFNKTFPKAIFIKKENNIDFRTFVQNNKFYIILCLCITGLFVGYTCIDNFTLLIIQSIGESTDDMGFVLGFKAFIESIAIFLFPYFLKRYKLENLLKLSAFAFSMKILFTLLASNIIYIYVAQLFQALSFGFIYPGMVEYINRNIKSEESIRAHALFSMTIGLGSIISGLYGGFVSNNYGIKAMELTSLLISVISALGFLFVMKHMENKTN